MNKAVSSSEQSKFEAACSLRKNPIKQTGPPTVLHEVLLQKRLTIDPFSVCVSVGEEEQGSMAEVTYYSYEYDPDSEPFLADAEGQDDFDLPDGGENLEQKVLLPADPLLSSVDTKNTPERWYEWLL